MVEAFRYTEDWLDYKYMIYASGTSTDIGAPAVLTMHAIIHLYRNQIFQILAFAYSIGLWATPTSACLRK
jgi:hypothetical protein